MGYTHSHRCWVGIAPIRGVETHQRWDAVRHPGGRAELHLTDEHALHRGDVATLVPPRDVHNHGHVAGSGPSPTRSSSSAMTCSCSTGRNTTHSKEPGGRSPLVTQARQTDDPSIAAACSIIKVSEFGRTGS